MSTDLCEATDSADSSDQFDFAKGNLHEVKNAILSTDWLSILSSDDTNARVDAFYRHIYNILNAHVPMKKPYMPKKVVWWTSGLSLMRNRTRKARKRFSRFPSAANRLHLQETEALYAFSKESHYLEYISSVQHDVKDDPKSFWNFVRNKKSSNGLPVNLQYGNRRSTTREEAVNICADFFESTFVQHAEPISDDYLRHVTSFDLDIPRLVLSEHDVCEALSRVDVKKGPGPDRLSPLFLSSYAEAVALPGSIIFNHSLEKGVFPDVWKLASIVPIHKAGSVHNIEN